MQKIYTWLKEKAAAWIDLGYGEIITGVQKSAHKIIALTIFHTMLLLAIFAPLFPILPGMVGIVCWGLTGFFFLWNLALDEQGGVVFRPLRNLILALEQKSGVFFLYIRLVIPAILSIITIITVSSMKYFAII